MMSKYLIENINNLAIFINLQKLYGVWQVDCLVLCPFSTGIGQGDKK
jgi:hypothetical protein